MNKQKAIKKIKRKLTRAKPCPFCGEVPEFGLDFYGALTWRRCCILMGPGSILASMRDRTARNHGAWWNTACSHVDLWNKRHEPPPYTLTTKDKRLNKRVNGYAKLLGRSLGERELATVYRYHRANENARTRTVIYYHA